MRELVYMRGRDPEFALAMYRAEKAAEPKPAPEDPRDIIGRTRLGYVVRRNGESFAPGPFLDLETIPLLTTPERG